MSEKYTPIQIVSVALIIIAILVSGASLFYTMGSSSKIESINLRIEELASSIETRLTELEKPKTPVVLEPIRIGYIAALTGSGAYGGTRSQAAAIIAVDRINKDGGLLMPEGRRRVDIIFEDDKGITAEAAAAAKKLIEKDKVHILVGGALTQLAIMPIAEEKNVPYIIDDGSNWKISAPKQYGGAMNEWSFHCYNTDEQNARAVVPMIVQKFKITKIAYLADNSDWGLGSITSYEPQFIKLGVQTVYKGIFDPTEIEYTAHLLAIKNSGADIIHMTAAVEGIVNIMRQYHELGLEIPIFSVGGIRETVIALAGNDILGIWDIAKYNPEYDNPENKYLYKQCMDRYNYVPELWNTFGFNAINIALDAIYRAGSTDSAKIRDSLEGTSYVSCVGLLKFDKYHQVATELWLARPEIVDGKIVKVMYDKMATGSIDWDAEKGS